jgi:hypothetical protein
MVLSVLYMSWSFHSKKCYKYANQSTLTFARIFHYNIRDFEQFQRKRHLPISCYGLQEARKKGSACHLQEKTGNCSSHKGTKQTPFKTNGNTHGLWKTQSLKQPDHFYFQFQFPKGSESKNTLHSNFTKQKLIHLIKNQVRNKYNL